MMTRVWMVVDRRAEIYLFLVAKRTFSPLIVWLLAKSVRRERQSSACSHASVLWLRVLLCRALRFTLAFVFFMLFSSECGNCSGGLWEEAAKRIPLRMYKRSGAVCISTGYEIPLASEESRTSEESGPGFTFRTEWDRNRNLQVLLCVFMCI